ncbi:MAG: FtsX-like permease family protein [Ruminococcaceae bacterium]|nr:FtsX-like permease family protein [Oscillospiraceae bacterium]
MHPPFCRVNYRYTADGNLRLRGYFAVKIDMQLQVGGQIARRLLRSQLYSIRIAQVRPGMQYTALTIPWNADINSLGGMAMDLKKRLLRKPGTTVLWLVLTALMAAFLTTAAALSISASRLASSLDESHTAIAVRTNRAVTRRIEGGQYVWDTSERVLTQEDKDWLESLDSVKAVRVHALCGGTSPDFEPLLGLKREFSWRGSGDETAYFNAIFAGTVVSVRSLGANVTQLGVATEEVCALHPEYSPVLYTQSPDNVNYLIVKSYYQQGKAPEGDVMADYFREGERYILSGELYAARSELMLGMSGSVWTPTLYLFAPIEQDGMLVGDATGFPLAQRLDGDAETFIASHPIWQEYRDALERQLHSLPVVGTERLESLYMFVKNDARIIEGRSFTQEEYETGARVMVISEGEAQKHGVSVGDTVRMSQFRCDHAWNDSTDLHAWTGMLNRPSVGRMKEIRPEAEGEEFTVVGVYRMTDYWPEGSYDFTADTVFIPRKAQISDAFGPESEDIYGVYLSVELVNGKLDDFRLAVAQSKFAGQFFAVEQGFEQVQKNLNGLTFSAQRLLWIAAGAWGIFLLLYLLMYQSAQRRNLGVMRSVGASPREAAGYLFSSGALVAAAGTALGTLLGGVALRAAQNAVLADVLEQVGGSAFSGGMAISEEALADMVLSNGLSIQQLLLLAAAQLAVMCLMMWIQARRLAGQAPRTLMGV